MVCSIFVALLLSQPPSVSPPSNTPVQRQVEDLPNDGKPYVLFSGVSGFSLPGIRTIRNDSFDVRGIIIAVPIKAGYRFYRMADGSTESDVRQELQRREIEVSRTASPFAKSGLPLPRRTADGNGPWLAVSEQERLHALMPKNVSLPDLRFYRRTNHSQRIAVTNDMPTIQWYRLDQHDHWGNAPTSFNPNTTKPHWAAPGGLANVDGWESHVAAYLPESPMVWKQPLPIANGGMIPGYVWSYPVGTMFADLLTHEGKVFELRIREKNANGWDSYVAYKDTSNAPNGYHGAGKRCVECHASGPGSSEQYGIVLRGCDTVFSFSPFD